jgi:hypothetical protein
MGQSFSEVAPEVLIGVKSYSELLSNSLSSQHATIERGEIFRKAPQAKQSKARRQVLSRVILLL